MLIILSPTSIEVVAFGTMSAPKRDKFAALAAAQGARPSSSSEPAVAARPSSTSEGTPNAVVAPSDSEPSPKPNVGGGGGKFAALQKKASTAKRGDKFSAMASRASSAVVPSESATLSRQSESIEKIKEWTSKCQQRDGLWRDLEDAEVLVMDMLGYAQQTVECFARQTTADAIDPSEIQKLSSDVQNCIRQIHSKLAPAADFIQAYKDPTRINMLYQVRVEEGLAIQREKVLKELVDLDKPPKDDPTKKRKREE